MTDRQNILIVEDDLMIGLHMKVEIEAMGYGVIGPVSSVKGARAALREEDVSAAILDVKLYKENSLTLAQDLWEKAIPFIFVTGSRLGLMQRQFPNVTILAKPINFSDMQSQLAAICPDLSRQEDAFDHRVAS